MNDDSLATIDVDPIDLPFDKGQAVNQQLRPIDPAQELKNFEAVVELQRNLIPATIRVTRRQDWISMGANVYLQGTGVERISALWGLVFPEPKVTKEQHEDGSFSYIVEGTIASRRTGVIMHVVGGRSSNDGFYKNSNDPVQLRKAALTNWMTRGASMICGLRGLTVDDLNKAGLGQVQNVQFKSGAKGGGPARHQSGVMVVPFGKYKGQPITEVPTEDLSKLADYFAKCVDDPKKAKFKAQNEKSMSECAEEIAGRESHAENDGDDPFAGA